jgi:opacity protein-like surface antigen
MRALVIAAAALVLSAAPSSAQTRSWYAFGAGGFAVSPDGSSGDILGEAGVRVAPRLFVFGDIGQIHNLEPSDLQPAVDSTTSLLSQTGLTVTSSARVPAWYSIGGLRLIVPNRSVLTPYVFGGGGFARLTPTAQFTYSAGTLPGSTPSAGDDVTGQIVSLGDFTPPPATTALMLSLGGGVEAPVAPHLMVDVGYRYSRIATTTPLNSQGLTFGFGYRF